MNAINLDKKEQQKADRLENILFRMFKENFRYLLRMYNTLKLPVAMFKDYQLDWIKESYRTELTTDQRFILIGLKS